ncbi:MAG: prefoldin subunit alpha [archaeon]
MENSQQELMFQLSMYEQQIQQLQQQLQAIEQGILELGSLTLGLEGLKCSKGKEIMAPIGRGIFVKAKVLSEDLTVDVGGRNFVKKSISDTKKIIDDQIKKLEDVKQEMSNNLERIGLEVNKVISEAQEKEVGKKGKK